MRFTVDRASQYYTKDSPCDGACKSSCIYYWDNCHGGRYETTVEFWYIDIDSLDDLLKFIRENGECVIYKDFINGNLPSSTGSIDGVNPDDFSGHITIYDSYIE